VTAGVTIDGHAQPLESDRTAALAFALEGARVWDTEFRGMLEWLPRDRADDGLFLMEPYRPDRIPLVLVHARTRARHAGPS
jgi:hypothetical protein